MTNKKDIIQILSTYIEKKETIKSMLLIGSFGRNTPKPNSDIDIQLVVNERLEMSLLMVELNELFKEEVKFSFFMKHKNKVTLFLNDELLKVELFAYQNNTELNQLFLGSEIENVKHSIVFDKTGTLNDYLTSIFQDKKRKEIENTKETVLIHIDNFINRFEGLSNAHSKSDGYKFGTILNNALNSLVRLIYLCEGKRAFEYMPKNFLTDFSYPLELGIEKIGTMDLTIANKHKRQLLDLFISYLPKTNDLFELKINIKELESFLESVYQRDFFWNFRDASKFNSNLKEGVIFRTSALCLIENNYEKEVKEQLTDKNVSTIIDLRADRELKEINYTKDYNKIDFVWAPFDPWNQSIEFQNTYNYGTNAEKAYRFFVKECKDSIKNVMVAIINSQKAVAIHCHAGKDRTGVIFTLLHLLSKADKQAIINDYMASEMDTNMNLLNIILDEVQEYGGIEEYLKSCDLEMLEIEKLKEKICR